MSGFSSADGTRLAYHLEGEGEPLVCLPGGPMRASAYLGDLGGLAAHRRLVKLDLRGTGGSAVPADRTTYRCDRQVDDVEGLRLHLGLERIDLLAHSAAGDLAILYAARHPERVRSLVLLTARGRALGVDFTTGHRLEAAGLRTAEPWYPRARPAFDALWSGTADDEDFDAAAPFFYGRWDDAARAHAAVEAGQTNEEAAALYASPAAFDPSATREAIASLNAPVLVVAGELDSGPLPRIAAEIAALFPNARLDVVPAAGHFPWLDAPARLRRSITDFLAPAESAVPPHDHGIALDGPGDET
ncbi:alpha/beta hydrolase [Actinocorallia sp. B10E7]|uniref:alpha/beta fold hydrolase n=1 Tax=Actinocorallia sp. B10E7 TaxID=3153558 RepID=UPI00325F0ACA